MKLTHPSRVLATLCLLTLLVAAPVPTPLAYTTYDSVAPQPQVVTATKEKLRLVEHLNQAWRVPVVLAHRIVGAAYREAQAIGMAPTLLLALIAKESGFNPNAKSSYGAVGLMQVVPRFHMTKLQSGESLRDPETNIRVGAQVLNEYVANADGTLDQALVKYSGSARKYANRVREYQSEFEAARASAL